MSEVCEHTIGIMFNNTVTVKEALKEAKSSQHFQSCMSDRWVPLQKFVDGRSGYIQRFNYCPYCGVGIDWVGIRKLFKEEDYE